MHGLNAYNHDSEGRDGVQFLYAHGIRARANLLSKLIPAILVVNLEYGTLALFIYLNLFKGTLWRRHTRIVPAFDQLAATADSHPLPLSMYVRQLSFLVFRARDICPGSRWCGGWESHTDLLVKNILIYQGLLGVSMTFLAFSVNSHIFLR